MIRIRTKKLEGMAPRISATGKGKRHDPERPTEPMVWRLHNACRRAQISRGYPFEPDGMPRASPIADAVRLWPAGRLPCATTAAAQRARYRQQRRTPVQAVLLVHERGRRDHIMGALIAAQP